MADIAQLVNQMQPVFVVAPTARNGVTLVQRLLNSSRQIVVYGENLDFMDRMPKLVHSTVQTHTTNGPHIAEARQKFLKQTTEFWTSNLWPDTQTFMMIAFEAFYKAALLYQQQTQQDGISRWGVKNPLTEPQMIERLTVLMKGAKFVFIYRSLFDVARSAKARQFIKNETELRNYGVQWAHNLTTVLNAKWGHVQIIRYEDLLSEPDAHIQQLEQFAGISGIDRSVMDRKINTFTGQTENGMSPTGYIPPADLTSKEQTILREAAGSALQLGGYAEDSKSAA